jgi:DNA-directed RNA polymerase specialized sigma24 family protein
VDEDADDDDDDDARHVLTKALSSDRAAMRKLVDRLTPVIWSRVTRMAQRAKRRTPDQVKQIGEDLMQEVFAALFQDDGRALRAWVPERGLSLESYVGLLAEHQAASILRSGRRSAWREDATEDVTLTRAVGSTEHGTARLHARDLLVRVLERVRAELSPRGVQLLELLVVEEQPIEEVSKIMDMKADALYAWRSRLIKLATKIAEELEGGDGGVSENQGMTRSTLGEEGTSR